MQERPNQITNLLLEEQIDNIIFGQLSNYEDFENDMKCVVKYDNMWNEAFNKQSRKYVVVFQLGKGNDKEAQGITNAHNKVDVNQQSKLEIKFKINIDAMLDQWRVDQLWELLQQFLDVIAYHKSKLGCYKIGEHIMDTQGFPPY
jgi:hypothetical protein